MTVKKDDRLDDLEARVESLEARIGPAHQEATTTAPVGPPEPHELYVKDVKDDGA